MATATETQHRGETRIFVAKQPIVTGDKETFGYELLFRSGQANHYTGQDGYDASMRVMANTLTLIGLDELTGKRKFFINLPRKALLNEDYRVMPRGNIVYELLESVVPDEEVVAACRKLKKHGYELALDDFVYCPTFEPLLEIADYIKVDFRLCNRGERREMAERFALRKVKMLAEKVETHEEFREAMHLGYVFFQGFFFQQPEVLSGQEMSVLQRSRLRLLRLVTEAELRYDEIQDAIKADPAVSYKLLRYINSAHLGIRNHITSIKQGLAMLGEDIVRKWVPLAVLGATDSEQSHPMIELCLTRARFCELVAPELQLDARKLELFMLGLLSGIEAVYSQPLDEVLIKMPVSRDVKVALHGARTQLGKLLHLVRRFEKAAWSKADDDLEAMGLDANRVVTHWHDALRWVQQISKV